MTLPAFTLLPCWAVTPRYWRCALTSTAPTRAAVEGRSLHIPLYAVTEYILSRTGGKNYNSMDPG